MKTINLKETFIMPFIVYKGDSKYVEKQLSDNKIKFEVNQIAIYTRFDAFVTIRKANIILGLLGRHIKYFEA